MSAFRAKVCKNGHEKTEESVYSDGACKICKADYVRRNKDRIKEYRTNNKDRKLETNKNWYWKNRDLILPKRREYQDKNRDSIKTATAEWRDRNKERRSEYNRAYLQQNRQKIMAKKKEYKRNNPEKVKLWARANKYNRKIATSIKFPQKQWKELLALYQGCCAYCGVHSTDLTCDHIVPLKLGGDNNIENLVPACRRCNSSKRHKPLAEWNPVLAGVVIKELELKLSKIKGVSNDCI